MPTDTPTRNAFLRWAGSKRKLLPRLLDNVPSGYGRYVEPFAGSACLFFALKPPSAVLADINGDLVATYVQVRDNVEELIERLSALRRGKRAYYALRARDPALLPVVDRAARFIFLNRFCFNGLYRTNKSGSFNVPYGGQKSGSIPPAELLRACSTALQNVTLMESSFEGTLNTVLPGDFVYMDPPYSISSRRVFNEYSNASFAKEQLDLLRTQLERLDEMGVPFLVSYGYSREALDLAQGFASQQTIVQRQIAGFAANRRKSRELMITNF